MDLGTVTFIAGVISCIIGISTFVSGRMSKAEHNGSLEEKINQALSGISSINQKLEASSRNHHEIALLVQSNTEQIKTLFTQYDELKQEINEKDNTRDALIELIHTLRSK